MKELFKKWELWSIVANIVFLSTIIIMAIISNKEGCPEPNKPKLDEINYKKIKQIQNAETKKDIDSLLLELYGFESK